jgi:hypothetical protein
LSGSDGSLTGCSTPSFTPSSGAGSTWTGHHVTWRSSNTSKYVNTRRAQPFHQFVLLTQAFALVVVQEPIAHPEYTVMVRNGRSSCSGPAIQQTPRKGGFREIFRASEGRLILSVDYDFIELCTLASVCEARYGYSNLAQVIRKVRFQAPRTVNPCRALSSAECAQGVDPHSFTASMFEGVELAEFMSWKESPTGELRTKFTTLRQRAKVHAATASIGSNVTHAPAVGRPSTLAFQADYRLVACRNTQRLPTTCSSAILVRLARCRSLSSHAKLRVCDLRHRGGVL